MGESTTLAASTRDWGQFRGEKNVIETASVEIRIKTLSVNAGEAVELVLAFEKAILDLAMQHLKSSNVDVDSKIERYVRVYSGA